MKELGLEVETLENPLHLSSPIGTRVSVDLICWDFELEIFGILLTVDLRVMDMSEFDVILEMDWLKAHQVVIDCDRRRVTTLMSLKVIHFQSIFLIDFYLKKTDLCAEMWNNSPNYYAAGNLRERGYCRPGAETG